VGMLVDFGVGFGLARIFSRPNAEASHERRPGVQERADEREDAGVTSAS
jgi:hypothetical protein